MGSSSRTTRCTKPHEWIGCPGRRIEELERMVRALCDGMDRMVLAALAPHESPPADEGEVVGECTDCGGPVRLRKLDADGPEYEHACKPCETCGGKGKVSKEVETGDRNWDGSRCVMVHSRPCPDCRKEAP